MKWKKTLCLDPKIQISVLFLILVICLVTLAKPINLNLFHLQDEI